MLVYSLGHAAARDTTSGTLFVKSIHDVFREHAKTKDILTLMTQVKSCHSKAFEGEHTCEIYSVTY